MTKVIEQGLTSIGGTLAALWGWLLSNLARLTEPGALNPANWDVVTWLGLLSALLTIMVVWLLASRPPRRSRLSGNRAVPELLVSKGEVRQASASAAQVLALKVSNLNDDPVQLLEITLQTEPMSSPLIVEAAELLSSGETAELEAVLPNNMTGDKGDLTVYFMLARSRKLYRLKTSFSWEPWAARYKVAPLGQSLKQARKLESDRLNGLRKRSWHEQYFQAATPHSVMPTNVMPNVSPKQPSLREASRDNSVEPSRSARPIIPTGYNPVVETDEALVIKEDRYFEAPQVVAEPAHSNASNTDAQAVDPEDAALKNAEETFRSLPFRSRPDTQRRAEMDFPNEF